MNAATGEVIGKCYRRHRSVEFRKFLAIIDKAVPAALEVHLVLDNYGTRKTAMIHNWLARRARYHFVLHAHERLVDQPGGALVRGAEDSARFVFQYAGT